MNLNVNDMMNESALTAIHYGLVSLYEEPEENFYLNGKYLYKNNRFKVSDNVMDFSKWIAKRYKIFNIGSYHVSHYIEYLKMYENYDSYIKMKIENDLQILQLVLIRHFHAKDEYPNMFITKRNQFDVVYCPYCKNVSQLKHDTDVYGKGFGNYLYVCEDCEAQIRTHGKSIVPKGTLATKDLRQLRMSCYNVIQKFIEENNYGEMLEKLKDVLGVREDHAQIGVLDVNQCNAVLQHFK